MNKKQKPGFSPWQTKQNSFQDQDIDNFPKQSNNLKSDKIIRNSSVSNQLITTHYNQECQYLPKKNVNANRTGLLNRRVSLSSQKTQRSNGQELFRKRQSFDSQKWKTLAASSRDKFKSQYGKMKKNYGKHFVSEYKPLLPYKQNAIWSDTKQQHTVLQQVSVKNFKIQGHYSDKDNFFQQVNRRKENTYVLKHKFCELKKSVNMFQSKQNIYSKEKRVVIKGKDKERQSNLFRVVKLQRQINKIL